VYNAEGQWTFERVNNVTYLYNGDGERVETSGGASGTRIYAYDAVGHVVEEMSQTGAVQNEYLYFGDQLIARVPSQSTTAAYYYFGDNLGTSRVIVDQTGAKCYDADYFPWGAEQQVFTNTCPQNYKFTGKERDPDLAVDYFGARFYKGDMARFYSPDWSATEEPVPYAKLDNPQTLNLYTYVANNPTTLRDPNGHDMEGGGEGSGDGEGGGGDPAQQANTAQDKNAQPTRNNDPTAPPPPPTPDPAGTRTDPALNPTDSNPSTTSSPADQTQAPMESRGQQPRGERRITGKPEFQDKPDKPDKLPKGVKVNPDKPGEYQVKDPHTGNWVDKPKGWSPNAQKVGIGVAIVTGAVITGHAVAGCFASGACEAGLAFAF